MFGAFDELFDFNGDGKLDASEEATGYMVLKEFFDDNDDNKTDGSRRPADQK